VRVLGVYCTDTSWGAATIRVVADPYHIVSRDEGGGIDAGIGRCRSCVQYSRLMVKGTSEDTESGMSLMYFGSRAAGQLEIQQCVSAAAATAHALHGYDHMGRKWTEE
jgi:hypothetical protein